MNDCLKIDMRSVEQLYIIMGTQLFNLFTLHTLVRNHFSSLFDKEQCEIYVYQFIVLH